MSQLTNDERIKYVSIKDDYKIKLEKVGRSALASSIAQISKNINLELNGSLSTSITNARELQGQQVMDLKDLNSAEVENDFDFDSYVNNYRKTAKNNARNELLAGYVAIKDKLDKRTFWDKVLHPFKTMAENNALKDYREEMNKFNITDKDIYDFYVEVDPANIRSAATGNESERVKVEIDFIEQSAKGEIEKISDITPALDEEKVEEL